MASDNTGNYVAYIKHLIFFRFSFSDLPRVYIYRFINFFLTSCRELSGIPFFKKAYTGNKR